MLVILVGKSGSGKDAVLKELVKDGVVQSFVSDTTRPMREGETDGIEYHFKTREQFLKGFEAGEYLEHRKYDTLVNGSPDTWYYGASKREYDPEKMQGIIVDVDGARSFLDIFSRENCFIVSVETSDAVREQRAKQRGSFNRQEWDRRFRDDAVKFSPDKIGEIANFYVENDNSLKDTVKEIEKAIDIYTRAERLPYVQYVVSGDYIHDKALLQQYRAWQSCPKRFKLNPLENKDIGTIGDMFKSFPDMAETVTFRTDDLPSLEHFGFFNPVGKLIGVCSISSAEHINGYTKEDCILSDFYIMPEARGFTCENILASDALKAADSAFTGKAVAETLGTAFKEPLKNAGFRILKNQKYGTTLSKDLTDVRGKEKSLKKKKSSYER